QEQVQPQLRGYGGAGRGEPAGRVGGDADLLAGDRLRQPAGEQPLERGGGSGDGGRCAHRPPPRPPPVTDPYPPLTAAPFGPSGAPGPAGGAARTSIRPMLTCTTGSAAGPASNGAAG